MIKCMNMKKLADCRLKTVDLFRLLLTAYCLLVFTTELHPTIRYVSHTGTSTPPYTSWETAADSIQKAIDICEPGDTVLVANGVYYEALYINKTIHLIGSSMDSTIINGSQSDSTYIVYFTENNSTFKNFKIIGPGNDKGGMVASFSNIIVSELKIESVRIAILVGTSSVLLKNIIVKNIHRRGIYDICPADSCKSQYLEMIINSDILLEDAAMFFFGGSPTIKNSIIVGKAPIQSGISFESQKRVVFKNNLISGFQNRNVSVSSHSDTVFLVNNNSMNVQVASAFNINQGNKTVLRNNIIQNTNIGVYGFDDVVNTEYNLFNNVNEPVSGSANLGLGSIFADPMFVNDTLPVPNGSYDLHLQAYSPAIDAGDPDIIDVNGTRSDIGMYGGPDGERYEYLDLPPRTPKDFTYNFDTTYNLLTLNWKMNTEYDFMNYNIYRDTVSGFIPGDENLLAQRDTSKFTDYLGNINSPSVYYRITAVDSQYNESQPGNEIAVTITGIEQDIKILKDYILYQNYPNPFNPSTKIGYELKERAYVKLMVYDIKGELISILVNKEQESGYYEVEFNVGNGLPSVPNSLASGIYQYRIEVIGEGRIPVYSDMKKMLMIK